MAIKSFNCFLQIKTNVPKQQQTNVTRNRDNVMIPHLVTPAAVTLDIPEMDLLALVKYHFHTIVMSVSFN